VAGEEEDMTDTKDALWRDDECDPQKLRVNPMTDTKPTADELQALLKSSACALGALTGTDEDYAEITSQIHVVGQLLDMKEAHIANLTANYTTDRRVDRDRYQALTARLVLAEAVVRLAKVAQDADPDSWRFGYLTDAIKAYDASKEQA
jgi:hypothetical protein